MAQSEKRGLGRGLSALMSDVTPVADQSASLRRPDATLPIERIVPNPDQPRRSFNADALSELAASVREKGILQPLIVRPYGGEPPVYQIVAGERRWRAAQAAQIHDIPVIIRDFSDTEVLEIAIVENIQRADLNPIDEARGYRQLIERFGHTQEKLGEAMGKSRSHIANALRLMQLPDEVQDMLADGLLSAGHARALIITDDPVVLARQVVAKKLSVRETEKLAKSPQPRRASSKGTEKKDADTRVLENDLSAALGMKVTIDHMSGGHGRVTIDYKSLDSLDELCRLLSINRPAASR